MAKPRRHYPLLAYQVAFGLNVALQIAALVWLDLPRLRALIPFPQRIESEGAGLPEERRLKAVFRAGSM